MSYGDRLREAMSRRGAALGRDVTRLEIANIAGCSRQNIGMILTNAEGNDQKLNAVSHAKVAKYLKVDPDWLLKGDVADDRRGVAPLTLIQKLTKALETGGLSEAQTCIISDLLDEFTTLNSMTTQRKKTD